MKTESYRLRIESVKGSPVNDYRTIHGSVQLRVLDSSGRALPGDRSRWRLLDDNDIQLHHALGTVVSQWLHKRLQDDSALENAA
jgi:hypothetical protein